MPNFGFNQTEILAFALILIRVSSFVVASPLFVIFSAPNLLKVFLSITLSILLFPVMFRTGLQIPGDDLGLTWCCLKEAAVGLIVGYISRMFFYTVSVGAQMIATAMGLANAQLFNPASGAMETTIEHLYGMFGLMVYLGVSGHHYLISGLAKSFEILPIGPAGIEVAVFQNSGLAMAAVVEGGIKIAGPVLVAIFMVNLTMAVVGRAVPQMNILMTTIPVTVFVGLIVMIVTLPVCLSLFDVQVRTFAELVMRFMTGM